MATKVKKNVKKVGKRKAAVVPEASRREEPKQVVRRFLKQQFMLRGGVGVSVTPRQMYEASRSKVPAEEGVTAYSKLDGRSLDDNTPLRDKVSMGRKWLIEQCLNDMAVTGEIKLLNGGEEYTWDSEFSVTEMSVRGLIKAEFTVGGGKGTVLTLRQLYDAAKEWIPEDKATAFCDGDTTQLAKGRKRLIYRCLSDMKLAKNGEVDVTGNGEDWDKEYRSLDDFPAIAIVRLVTTEEKAPKKRRVAKAN